MREREKKEHTRFKNKPGLHSRFQWGGICYINDIDCKTMQKDKEEL